MTYNPHQKVLSEVRTYFTEKTERFPGVLEKFEEFLKDPTLGTARSMMGCYFKLHQKDDIESLRMATATFADKRLVKSIVDSIINDDNALAEISHRSYPHPIGFDKLVLYDDKETGFKFRLHIYWRSNQRAVMERMHLHRFEMASAIVSGELTNHTWRVANYIPENDLLPKMEIPAADDLAGHEQKTRYAYSGYWRDKDGILHKKILGTCDMIRGISDTFPSGNTYAQVLSDAHYVETNAETGKSNGDVCSTIYVHSGGLTDNGGRKMPVLFEDFQLANPDQIIDNIPEISKETLKNSLIRYRDFLQDSLDFYEWVYDPKHGRDLSTGMIAGYLLSESKANPHTIKMWIEHEDECKATLEACSVTLAKLVKGEINFSDLSDDDRNKRYYAILLDKARNYSGGKDAWLVLNGDLVKEMWRYCGALKGEKPDITALKPMWEAVVGKKMPGGAHYGHIAAMIEATLEANAIALKYFKSGTDSVYKEDGSPTSRADLDIEASIRSKLAEHYPTYRFTGEENGHDRPTPPVEGEQRWLVDPIDGTRNFLSGRDEFSISIACETFKNGKWETTDGVVSLPVAGKLFWAEKGHGAYLIERDDLEHTLKVPAPSNAATLHNRVIDISLKGFGIDGEASIFRAFHNDGAVFRNTGSCAIMLATVAGKGSHGVILTAKDYDIAAAKLIASEAGAVVSDFEFQNGNQLHNATIAGIDVATHDRLKSIALMAVNNVKPEIALKL